MTMVERKPHVGRLERGLIAALRVVLDPPVGQQAGAPVPDARYPLKNDATVARRRRENGARRCAVDEDLGLWTRRL
jgi:hypothetical protein